MDLAHWLSMPCLTSPACEVRETREPLLFFPKPLRKADDRKLLPPDNILELIADYAVAVGLARAVTAAPIIFEHGINGPARHSEQTDCVQGLSLEYTANLFYDAFRALRSRGELG
jgi:hypothetical protein